MVARRALADQPAAQLVGLGHRRRQPDGLQAGREAAQPRQAERQQMAALGGDQRMQLVEDDVAQVREEARGVRRGDQQRQLLGRGQQDVGRLSFWRWRLCARRVAGARLDRDRQAHLVDRLAEVALDVDGQRLQRRDVERVDAACASPGLRLRPRRRDRSASAGSRPASCRRRSARSAAPSCPAGPRPAVRAGAARGDQPARRTSRTNGSGSMAPVGLRLQSRLARHAPDLARARKIAKRILEQKGIMRRSCRSAPLRRRWPAARGGREGATT